MLKGKLKKTLFYTLLLCGIASSSFADFELGMQLYQSKNYENAFKEFNDSAQFGDHDAQYNLGVMYYRGEFVIKNIPIAYAWLALAAQHQNYKDKSLHTKIFEKLSDDDKKIAVQEYSKIFEAYNNGAIDKKLTPGFVGTTLDFKNVRMIKSVPPNYPEDMLRKGKQGFVDITFTIDKNGFTKDHLVIYSISKSFEKEAIKALRKFQYNPMKVNNKPVDVNGYKTRHRFLLNNSKYDTKEIDETINEMRLKAKNGSNDAKLAFAYFLEAIPSFTKDYVITDNPNEWYIDAANQGNAAASYFLGRNILYGNMCTQDNMQSMAWLLKAAKQGISDAQYMLAIESFSGARFEKNDDKAFYWLSRAAENSKAAKIRYSWMLSTHSAPNRRDGKLAQKYLAEVDNDYYDKQSFYEAHAAVAAENGDFKNAVKWQKKALKDAKNLDLPLTTIELKLKAYESQNPWREEP